MSKIDPYQEQMLRQTNIERKSHWKFIIISKYCIYIYTYIWNQREKVENSKNSNQQIQGKL